MFRVRDSIPKCRNRPADDGENTLAAATGMAALSPGRSSAAVHENSGKGPAAFSATGAQSKPPRSRDYQSSTASGGEKEAREVAPGQKQAKQKRHSYSYWAWGRVSSQWETSPGEVKYQVVSPSITCRRAVNSMLYIRSLVRS